ncbi:MAG: apolipoprotein N-acyltransferase [Streptosporangiales bacterium]
MTRTLTEPVDVGADRGRAGPRRLPLGWAIACAAASGGALVLAFPRTYWWPLAPLAVALLVVAVYRQRLRMGLLLGGVHGLAFFPILVLWVQVIGYDAWVALSICESVYLALLGVGLALVSRLRFWPLWAAALWVGQEFLRDRVPFGGFSWGRLAFSQTDSPYTKLIAVGGAPLVTFAVALTGGLLAWAALRALTAPRQWVRPAGATAAAAVIASCGLAVPPASPSGETAEVAVVQGNVPRLGLDFLGQREAVLRNHAKATHELAAKVAAGRAAQPDLVVWPENASDIDPLKNADAGALISSAAKDIGAPILVGALVEVDGGKHLKNTGIVWDPQTGPGERYAKRHLVPFGEYLPMRDLLTSLFGDRLAQVGNFVPGDKPGRLHIGGVRVGAVMCYEVAYDDAMRDAAKGSQLLAVQTNNATYGGTLQLDQQFAMSRMRAIEHGRPVAIAATSGISALVRADGSVIDKSQQFTRASFVETMQLGHGMTLADRVGAWPERVLVAIGLLALLGALWRRRRDGRLDGR